MQITLSERGPSMWFLGDREVIVSLNTKRRGPVDVDLSKLSRSEFRNLIQAIKLQHIITKMTLENVISEYEALFSPPPSIPPPSVTFINQMNEKTEKLHQRAQYLISQSVRSLVATIRTTDAGEIRLLRLMKEIELIGKNRGTVIREIDKKLKGIDLKIETSTIQPEETSGPIVVESDFSEVTVHLGNH